eukprot:g10644.t1.1.5e17418b g10644  g10644.t1 contig4:2253610-2255535(-)
MSTRRRTRAPTSGYDDFNERMYRPKDVSNNVESESGTSTNDHDDKDGGQRKTPKKQLMQHKAHQFVRRKREQFTFAKLRRRLANLRIIDVVLLLAFGAKLATVLYHRCTTPLAFHTSSSPYPLLDRFIQTKAREDTTTNETPYWLKRWSERKMPFVSPVLYRRRNDDYSHDFESYPYEHYGQEQEKIKYKGMFRHNEFGDKKKELNQYGFAVVDDVVYHGGESREHTNWAIDNSRVIVLHPRDWEHYRDDNELDISHYPPAVGLMNEHEHQHYIDDGGDWDTYYSFDDDVARNDGTGLNEKRIDPEEGKKELCIRSHYYTMYHPTCNEMHATNSGYTWLLGEEIYTRRWQAEKHLPTEKSHVSKYLGSGYYRNAFLSQRGYMEPQGNRSIRGVTKESFHWDEVVFKTMRQLEDQAEGGVSEDDEILKRGWGFDPTDLDSFVTLIEDMRKDAMVMELLTSSKRSANLYSHCAMSSVIEFASVDMQKYIMPSEGQVPKRIRRRGSDNDHALEPLNSHISFEEKLEIALEMAKCVAVLHGFADGSIAHVDIQTSQFFRGRDGLIKIVDYNRAESIMYDVKQGKYCKWVNGQPADGSVSCVATGMYDVATFVSHSLCYL